MAVDDQAAAYTEGDRCGGCGYWWWDGEEAGWHSLVPKPWLGREAAARIVCCPMCQEDMDRG